MDFEEEIFLERMEQLELDVEKLRKEVFYNKQYADIMLFLYLASLLFVILH